MPIAAVQHLRQMHGGAQAHLMRAADGHFYVVKFVNNPQHRRVLANEWIAGHLARMLGLPAPEMAVVDVPRELIARTAAMVVRFGGRAEPCAAGLQFGSRLPTADPEAPIYDYLPEAGLDLVSNLGDFAGMMLLDKWTCNCNGRQVIYCRPRPRTRMRVYMIDQGYCFNAGEWTYPDSPPRGVYCRDRVYRDITGWDSFEPWLTRLEALEESAVFAAAEEIPPAWYGEWDALRRLLEKLIQRRSRVRELVWAVRGCPRAPFENWKEDDTGLRAEAGAEQRL